MIYTKNNIDGLNFQVKGIRTIYSIKVRTDDVLVSWVDGNTTYTIEQASGNFNSGVWTKVTGNYSLIKLNYLIL